MFIWYSIYFSTKIKIIICIQVEKKKVIRVSEFEILKHFQILILVVLHFIELSSKVYA